MSHHNATHQQHHHRNDKDNGVYFQIRIHLSFGGALLYLPIDKLVVNKYLGISLESVLFTRG